MNVKIIEQVQALLAENGQTLETLWAHCGNKSCVVPIDANGREYAPVYVEKFGKDAALVLEDGRIVGRPIAYMGHHCYFGEHGPDRLGTFRATIIPDGYRG